MCQYVCIYVLVGVCFSTCTSTTQACVCAVKGIALVLTTLHAHTQTHSPDSAKALPQAPTASSPITTMHLPQTDAHANTHRHVTTERLPCLPTSIHMLKPRNLWQYAVLIIEAACNSNAPLLGQTFETHMDARRRVIKADLYAEMGYV